MAARRPDYACESARLRASPSSTKVCEGATDFSLDNRTFPTRKTGRTSVRSYPNSELPLHSEGEMTFSD